MRPRRTARTFRGKIGRGRIRAGSPRPAKPAVAGGCRLCCGPSSARLPGGGIRQFPPPEAPGARLLVYQGDYGSLGDLRSVARRMAQFDVVVLSHASDRGPGRANTGGCLDTRFAPLPDLIRLVRRINPEIQIFGYVPATADAPIDSGCGLRPGARYSERPWQCPERVCRNSMSWVNDWLGLDAEIDGIFVDLVARPYLGRDQGQHLRLYPVERSSDHGKHHDPSAANIAFAAGSPYLAEDDFLMIEGFFLTEGRRNADPTLAAVSQILPFRGRGILLAALATEAGATQPGQTVLCRSARAREAVDFFSEFYEPGDVFQYATADLGLSSRILPRPCL